MALLPAGGTFSYNGITFTSLFASNVTSVPVWDNARRAVKYFKYTLTADGIIQADSGTGITLEAVRILLQQPCGPLEYVNKGFGDFSVNTPGGHRDVAYGPQPELLTFKPIGDEQAARVTWKVTTCIPECEGGVTNGMLAFTHETVWDIDGDGYTTVTYSGTVEIPANRIAAGSAQVTDTADRWRETAASAFPLQPAMKRESQQYKLSADKRSLDFVIRDKEMPVPLPADATQIDATETLTAQTDNGACSLVVMLLSLSAEITPKRGMDKQRLYWFIQFIIAARALPYMRKGFSVLPTELSLTDRIFGRSGGFSCTFRVIGDLKQNAQDIEGGYMKLLRLWAQAGELWTPLTNTDFIRWQQSLSDSSGSPRGWLGMRHTAREDAIVNICEDDFPRAARRGSLERRGQLATSFPVGNNLKPSNSWLEFTNEIIYEEDGSAVLFTPVAPLKETPPTQREIDAVGPGVEPGPVASSKKAVIQKLEPGRRVVMRGRARRAGFRIPPPVLLHVGGIKAIETGRKVSELAAESTGDVITWESTWRITYVLEGNMRPMQKTKPAPDAIKNRKPDTADTPKLRGGGSRYLPG